MRWPITTNNRGGSYDVLHPRAVCHSGFGMHCNGNGPVSLLDPLLLDPLLLNAMPVPITCCSVYVWRGRGLAAGIGVEY